MRRTMIAAAAVLVPLCAAFAAAPSDGVWSGAVEGAGAKCPQGTIEMRVTDGAIAGAVGLGGARIPFRGTVTADGSVTAAYNIPSHGVSGSISGRMTGGDFSGRFESMSQQSNTNCVRNVTAKHT